MKHLIEFLLKGLYTIIYAVTVGFGLMIMTVLLWDGRYIEFGGIGMSYIWKKE